MGEHPPPLPASRYEPLLRGPLILTAISRVLMIPLYFVCAVGSTGDFKTYFQRRSYYQEPYFVEKAMLATIMWACLLLSVLLAWLFFSRHKMFRPLMIYFCFFLPSSIYGVVMDAAYTRPLPSDNHFGWDDCALIVAAACWMFYYGFSPRIKRVFTR